MIFIAFSELKREIVNPEVHTKDLSISELRVMLSNKLGDESTLEIKGFQLSAQNLYFLMDHYEKEEYRVFSDWVLSDSSLFLYLRDKELPQTFKVKNYEGHTLKTNYYKFLDNFLSPKLDKDLLSSISEGRLASLLNISELKTLLPEENKIEIDHKLASFIRSTIEEAKTDRGTTIERMFRLEFIMLINRLDESFYQVKILFLETVKTLIKDNSELSDKGFSSLKRIKLNSTHKKEVDLFLSRWKNSKISKGTKLKHLFRTPLFYAGLLVLIVLIYILVPKETVQPNQNRVAPFERTGLDSLTIDEIKNTDSLLGFNRDTLIAEIEEFNNLPLVDRYQMIDSEDTLKNDLARSLVISMVADYEIQKAQSNSPDCKPLSMGGKLKFQLDGVRNVNDMAAGVNHKIVNNTSYDLYILLFKNDPTEAVYGSFVPSKGELTFQLVQGMRLIIYSGRDLTRFNPLQNKNGGYGSIVEAKRIDSRFTAHFCELNQFNLQLMSRSWTAMRKGGLTIISDDNGPIRIKSDVFEK